MDRVDIIGTMFVIVLILIVVIGGTLLRSMMQLKKVRDTNARFHQLVAPYQLTTAQYYRRPYAYGVIDGYSVAFKWFYPQPRTVPSYQPTLFLRVKLSKTADQQIYLTTAVEGAGSPVFAQAAGWEQAEDGFHLGRSNGVTSQEQQQVFALLSDATKRHMLDLHNRYGAVGITPEYETAMIGKPNALELVGGNEKVLKQLDLQVRLVLSDSTDTAAVKQWVNDALSLANQLSHDLEKQ